MKNIFKNLSPYKRRYIPIYIIMSITFLLELILIFTFPTITHNILVDPNNTSKKSGWPTRLSAPYIDMSSWVEPISAYSLNGAPDLGKLCDESGFKYFNLGFIQPDQNNPLETDGSIRWGWGGYYLLSEANQTNSQYQGIKQSLANLKERGGDFTISIGGQAGDAPWVVSQNQANLENFYTEIIETYEIKRLDLDIEESNQDEDQNIINAKAIKSVQDKTNIEITLTIPIMPTGWEQKQIKLINAYLDAGVDITLINSMTMCYGDGVYSNEDYGTASVRAITNSITQMKEIYSNHGIELTDDQAYLKTGATFSIGYESNLYPVFTLDMAKSVVNDAIKNNYGLVSMWSMGRDAQLESNSAISTKYNYSKILQQYDKNSNN
ncbi:MAG: chitinase [Clostridia bacterium]|nr:chitinase [Clostridia bacterium]